MSYEIASLCEAPNRESSTYKKFKCNLWGKKCRWQFHQPWYNRDNNKYYKCLRISQWGRAQVDINLNACWTKQKGENKGEKKCINLKTGRAVSYESTLTTSAASSRQLGLSNDAGKELNFFKNMDQKTLLIAGAAVLILMMR